MSQESEPFEEGAPVENNVQPPGHGAKAGTPPSEQRVRDAIEIGPEVAREEAYGFGDGADSDSTPRQTVQVPGVAMFGSGRDAEALKKETPKPMGRVNDGADSAIELE